MLSKIEVSGRSASDPGRVTLCEPKGTRWAEGRMNPEPFYMLQRKAKLSPLQGNELVFPGSGARSLITILTEL